MAQELTFFDDSSGVELVLRAGTEAKGESPGIATATHRNGTRSGYWDPNWSQNILVYI